MEIISIGVLTESFLDAFIFTWDLKGVIATAGLKLLVIPFHNQSIENFFIAFGGAIFFWKNKGLFFSGVSHAFNIFDPILSKLGVSK